MTEPFPPSDLQLTFDRLNKILHRISIKQKDLNRNLQKSIQHLQQTHPTSIADTNNDDDDAVNKPEGRTTNETWDTTVKILQLGAIAVRSWHEPQWSDNQRPLLWMIGIIVGATTQALDIDLGENSFDHLFDELREFGKMMEENDGRI